MTLLPNALPWSRLIDKFYGYVHSRGILPRNSCQPDRWLTFSLQATVDPVLANEDRDPEMPETFAWTYQLQATSNYVHWRVLDPSKPGAHITGDAYSEYRLETPEKVEAYRRRFAHSYDHTAPAYVIAGGHHDSCWRGHGDSLHGYPRVQKPGKPWPDNTRYFNTYEAPDPIVTHVSLSGTPKGDAESHPETATWANPTPDTLTGFWALLAAYGALYHQIYGESPTLYLDFNLGRFRALSDKEYQDRSLEEGDYRRRKICLTPYEQRPHHSVAIKLSPEGKITHTALASRWGRLDNPPTWKALPNPTMPSRETILQAVGTDPGDIAHNTVDFTHMSVEV